MSFIVNTARETGTISYHCATPHVALEKVFDFRRADYKDITIRTCDDVVVSESLLVQLAGRNGSYQPAH